MRLIKVHIKNFRSILYDDVELQNFTFFVGKNNYGKSNYLKAVDYLLSFSKTYSNIKELQNNRDESVVIEGYFEGIKEFTPQLKDSRHKDAVERLIDDQNLIRLRLTIDKEGNADTLLVNPESNETENPTGWSSNCRKLFPETILIPATADTADELQEKSTTALSKIKKELMEQFFASLSTRIESAFEPIDKYLHGESQERAQELVDLEKEFAEEIMGEFSSVKPSLRFTLPDSSIIGRGMRVDIYDGFHKCEIEQKGNGLQRTALFALMRLLSKHRVINKNKPAPLFLIEDLEAFLHPSAQMHLAESLEDMSSNYQTIATTHSPFVITEKLLDGYRRICRTDSDGSKCHGPGKDVKKLNKQDYQLIKNCLIQSGNLISLFSDIIVVVEGKEDSGFYPIVVKILNIGNYDKVSFVRAVGDGNANLHISYKFFTLMGFDRIYIIADLDCLFNTNFKTTLKAIKIDDSFIDEFRTVIGYTESGQPGLEYVLNNIQKLNKQVLENKIQELQSQGICILSKGSPAQYYANAFIKKHSEKDPKTLWQYLTCKEELAETEELVSIFENIITM